MHKIALGDPHTASSYDDLHTEGGFWSDHLSPQLKKHILALSGRSAAIEIDTW